MRIIRPSNSHNDPTKLALVASSPLTIQVFLRGHIFQWASAWSVTVINSESPEKLKGAIDSRASVFCIPIVRRISLVKDLVACYALIQHFRKSRYKVVFSITPKAGLLSMVGAYIAGVPIRVHCFTGQVWATRAGVSRLLLKSLDKLTSILATDVLVDSRSQREFLVQEKVLKPYEGNVIAHGSISGVDTKRFVPSEVHRNRVRDSLGIPSNDMVLLYLGRLNREKGLFELANAFKQARMRHQNLHLLLVGPDEDCIGKEIMSLFDASLRKFVQILGQTDSPNEFMAASDVFCLPSHREGFGTSVMEAAACGLPAIVSNIYGLTDAVVDGETGLYHIKGDYSDLARKISDLLIDDALRLRMSIAARSRAENFFSSPAVEKWLFKFLSTKLSVHEESF